jgi:UDP-N-acetylmuramoyl-tripeptide--D-alanyl-D-alanine ligase
MLDHSLAIGTEFMINNQKPEGNFNYKYDWVHKEYIQGESQVRQAGAMWGLALIYQDQPEVKVGDAVQKAIAFFERHSKITSDGARYVAYPRHSIGSTGAVALCILTYVDYLRAAESRLPYEKIQHYRKYLDEYLKFLLSAMDENKLWHRGYYISNGQPLGEHSPYYDGESLLALVKTSKYGNKPDLKQLCMDAADAGYQYNVREALQKDRDSDITKGYYQWASMAFFELATSDWAGTEKYGDHVLELADWMIDVHKTLKRTRNTGYAYEGIIHAYELAVRRGDAKRVDKYAGVINKGLGKLTSWQVGSPWANRFIRHHHQTGDPMAIGGVQNHWRESILRIDVTQHQMHAVILARRYVYKN